MLKVGLAATLLVVAAAIGLSLKDPKLGGMTIGEVFSDPKVAQMAKAACRGDTPRIAALIAEGVDVNAMGQNDFVPMFYALKCEQPAALEALLKAGANPNHADTDGINGTFAAISYFDPIYLRLMLKYGGDPNSSPIDGHTALVEAFSMGQYYDRWENFELLLNSGVDVNAPTSKRGVGMASYAAGVGHPSKAVQLLERGYNYDLESLARAIYGSALTSVSAEYPEPLRQHPEYKYLAIAAKMLKERGVDIEKVKRDIDEKNERVGAGMHNDYSFEDQILTKPEGP